MCNRTKQELSYLYDVHAKDIDRMRQLYTALMRARQQIKDLVTQVNALIAQAGSSVAPKWLGLT